MHPSRSLLFALSFSLGVGACRRAEETELSRLFPADEGARTQEERASPQALAPRDPEAEATGLVVVAPHPDDEVLMASGVILSARERGEAVRVIVLTNGDFDCRADGRARQEESVAGLAALGVAEEDVVFLGYPDGFLYRLGRAPLPPVRRREGARCARGATTYGSRGRYRGDYHAARFGVPAPYTAAALTRDLAAVLGEFDPERLIVTHPEDSHPDHAAAYVFVRRALAALDEAPEVWRAFVHNGDCWPTGEQGAGSCSPGGLVVDRQTPPLTGSLRGYWPDLRVEVPPSCRSFDWSKNPKLLAIAAHASQTHRDRKSYLFSFARRDETFFTEELEREPSGAWVPELAAVWARSSEIPSDEPEERRFVAEGWPARVSFSEDFQREEGEDDEPSVSVRVRAASHGYTVRFDERTRAIEIDRSRGESPGTSASLGHFPLPHDVSFVDAPGRFELRAEPRPKSGAAVELSLYLEGELLGVAVDPQP